jgi:hypothetical protein
VAGIALIALGIACWPGPPLVSMLIYSTVVALYLAYLGFAGTFTGKTTLSNEFAMSAFGTKRTSRPAEPMSAFGGKADIAAGCVTR